MRHAARHERGVTLLELVIVVAVIGILIGLALERVLPLVGRAQRAAFVQVERELRSSLLLAAAERITRGESHTLPELAAANPMELLLEPPANYAGTVASEHAADVPRASWFFDSGAGHLGYRVGRYTRFSASDGPPDRIELAIEFVYEDRDGDGVFDAAGDRFRGLRLAPIHAYDWPD